MYQNLVLSPTVLYSLPELPVNEAARLLYNLLTEELICDKGQILSHEYQIAMDEIAAQRQFESLSKTFLPTLISSGRFLPTFHVVGHPREKKELVGLLVETELASKDTWRITLAQGIHDSVKRSLKAKRDIEVTDIANYLDPEPNSRVRMPEVIQLEPLRSFDFRRWITKFLKGAKRVKIHDGYFCMPDPFEDLKVILGAIEPATPVHIITLSDESRQRSRKKERDDGIRVDSRILDLQKMLGLTHLTYDILDSKAMIKDRYIETDVFLVNLGHALGAVDSMNKVKHQATITVQLIR
jgi:hypothetical protein